MLGLPLAFAAPAVLLALLGLVALYFAAEPPPDAVSPVEASDRA